MLINHNNQVLLFKSVEYHPSMGIIQVFLKKDGASSPKNLARTFLLPIHHGTGTFVELPVSKTRTFTLRICPIRGKLSILAEDYGVLRPWEMEISPITRRAVRKMIKKRH